MEKKHKILVVTNDNVFFQLISTFVRYIDNEIEIIEVEDFSYSMTPEFFANDELIILDGHLHRKSPLDLLHFIRYKLHVYVDIWLFNDINSPEYIYKIKEQGVNKIIERPFDPTEIAKQIVEHLNAVKK